MDCENVNVKLWNKATKNQNTTYPNLFVSIHMGSPTSLNMIPAPERMNPELLGDPWESYDSKGNNVLDLDKLTFKLTDPNMIVVMFTDPGRLWAACSSRDEEDALFLSQPYWLNTRQNYDHSTNLLTEKARIYFPGDDILNSLVIWDQNEDFDIFPLTYELGFINKSPWSGFHKVEAHEYSDHSGMYKPMTLKYMLDQISRYHKGTIGRVMQPPFVVYISACNPYPEKDLGWNSGQISEIAHYQDLFNRIGQINKECLKERILETSTRNITRDGDAGNLGDSNDTDRFFDDSDSIFDKKFADNQSYRVENFGITMSNEPCETPCRPYFNCIPENFQCLNYCQVNGKNKKCRKIKDGEFDTLYGIRNSSPLPDELRRRRRLFSEGGKKSIKKRRKKRRKKTRRKKGKKRKTRRRRN